MPKKMDMGVAIAAHRATNEWGKWHEVEAERERATTRKVAEQKLNPKPMKPIGVVSSTGKTSN